MYLMQTVQTLIRHCILPTHTYGLLLYLLKRGPVVQSVVSLTSLLRVILLTILADSIHNILIFFAEKFQHICISLDVNFNESLTNDIVSFEQLGPECSKIIFQISVFQYILCQSAEGSK